MFSQLSRIQNLSTEVLINIFEHLDELSLLAIYDTSERLCNILCSTKTLAHDRTFGFIRDLATPLDASEDRRLQLHRAPLEQRPIWHPLLVSLALRTDKKFDGKYLVYSLNALKLPGPAYQPLLLKVSATIPPVTRLNINFGEDPFTNQRPTHFGEYLKLYGANGISVMNVLLKFMSMYQEKPESHLLAGMYMPGMWAPPAPVGYRAMLQDDGCQGWRDRTRVYTREELAGNTKRFTKMRDAAEGRSRRDVMEFQRISNSFAKLELGQAMDKL